MVVRDISPTQTVPAYSDVAERLRRLATEFDELHEAMNRVAQGGAEIPAPVQKDPRLVVDRRRCQIHWRDRPLQQPTLKEIALLEYLTSRPGIVRTREEIMDEIWPMTEVFDRNVDSHMKRIRKKFRAVDPKFDAIQTRYGFGYVWMIE